MTVDDYQADLTQCLEIPPFSLPADEKAARLGAALARLTRHHRQHCAAYARLLDVLGHDEDAIGSLADIPFLPVRLFKEYELASVAPDQVFKTMTSSGTSGQAVSRIFLDRATAAGQSKVLARLMAELIGRQRLPMLIVDAPGVLKDRQSFSARGAAILGFSLFGRDLTYALDDDLQPNLPVIETFLARHAGSPILVFGFTFLVWQHLYLGLRASGHRLALENALLLHGGGWKKLQDQAVGNAEFKAALKEQTGIDRVVNYYGMVEQTGSIYLECPAGHLHASLFSDILIRSPADFSVLPAGQTGLIETLSVLPFSYPGHALLTEDLGTLLGEDDCPCGWSGKHFTVSGRAPSAELRGCSDVRASHE
ncbi:MAG: acyl-protein synthetase [Rhodocyclaceae bacterium]|nr:acyl-protein synthetase [Rhodocyclaceae bacterium]